MKWSLTTKIASHSNECILENKSNPGVDQQTGIEYGSDEEQFGSIITLPADSDLITSFDPISLPMYLWTGSYRSLKVWLWEEPGYTEKCVEFSKIEDGCVNQMGSQVKIEKNGNDKAENDTNFVMGGGRCDRAQETIPISQYCFPLRTSVWH